MSHRHSDPGEGGPSGAPRREGFAPPANKRLDGREAAVPRLGLAPILAKRLESVALAMESEDVRWMANLQTGSIILGGVLHVRIVAVLPAQSSSSGGSGFPRVSISSGNEVAMPSLMRTIEGRHGSKMPLVGCSNLSQVRH